MNDLVVVIRNNGDLPVQKLLFLAIW